MLNSELFVYAHEGLERGAEVVAQTQDIREMVSENIARNPEKYGVFGENLEDYRILQQYIRLQKIQNPNNTVTGIGADNPNLKRLAKEQLKSTEAIKANERVRGHLDELRRDASKARKGLESEEYVFPKDFSDTIKEINAALSNRGQSHLEKVNAPELTTDRYDGILNLFPDGLAKYEFDEEDLSFTETTIESLGNKIKTLRENKEKIGGDLINTMTKHKREAGEYANLIETEQITHLEKHLNFLQQAQVYLKAYQGSKEVTGDSLIRDDQIKERVKTNQKDIKRLEREHKDATREQNEGKQKRIEAEIAGLKEQNRLLGYREKGTEGSVTESYNKIIEASRKKPYENVLLAMDMYLAVRENIGKKYKLPKDKEAYAFVMVTAMLNGTDNLDRIFEGLGPDYEVRLKKGGYTHGEQLKGQRFTSESRFPGFLNLDGYPNSEAIAEFRLTAEQAKIANLRQKITDHFTEAGGVLNGYALFADKVQGAEGVADVDPKEVNAKLEELKDQANQLIAALNDYKNFTDAPELNEAQISALATTLEPLNNVQPLPTSAAVWEWVPMLGGYSEAQKQRVLESHQALAAASVAFKPDSPINTAEFGGLEDNVIYEMLSTSSEAGNQELAQRIASGETELIEGILSDIDNNFVDKRNEERIKAIADALDMDQEEFETIYRDIRVAAMEEMSHFERLSDLNGINHEGIFTRYYKVEKAWQDPETSASNWEKDLESKLPDNGADSHAYKILFNIMAAGSGKDEFLANLIDPDSSGHENAREMLKGIVDELEARTNQANNDLKAQIDFEKGYYEQAATLTERAGGVGRHVFDKVFGPGVKPEIRLIYGFMAYWVISKGLKGQGWTGKGIRGAAIALGLGMVVEDTTGKAALKFLGIDSPAEIGRGAWLTTEAEKSNIEEDDDAGYRALDLLKGKKVEDVLDWYQKRGEYGQTDLDKAKNRGQSNFDSLIRAGLLSRGELQSIMPDEENKETVANKFVQVVELQLERWGHRVSGSTLGSRKEYIKAGFDDLRLHFTADGFRENAANGGVLYLSPSEADKLTGGSYKWNWKEATEVLQTASEWEEANLDVGLGGLFRTFKKEMEIYKTKALPYWLEIKGLGKYMTDEAIKAFYEDYGPAAWDTMKEWGEKGYKFTIEKKDELQIWWKEAETPLTIKKIAENTWTITKTGIAAPFAGSLELGKRVTSSMVDHIRRFDMEVHKWAANEHRVSFDLFPNETGPFNIDAATKEVLKQRKLDRLRLNFVPNGYEIFGKYEEDWSKVLPDSETGPKRVGLLARPNLLGDKMQRFDFRVEEGYINFMAYEPEIDEPLARTRTKAYRRAVEELVDFLHAEDPNNPGTKFIEHLKHSDEFTRAVESRDKDQIRQFVEPYIQKYGAYQGGRNGYIMMLRVPVPLHDGYRHVREYEYKDPYIKNAPTIKKKVRHNHEYYDRKTERWTFGDLNEYKKSIVFSLDDDIVNRYIEEIQKDGRWSREYMQTYHLWDAWSDTGSLDVAALINNVQGSIDNVQINDYKEYDNLKEGFFRALRDQYREKWFAEQHWSRNYETMHEDLKFQFGENSKILKDFEKYHQGIQKEAEKLSEYKRLREHFDEDFIEKQYRLYLAEKLTAAYRGEDKEIIDKKIKEDKWVEHFTKKFINEEVVNIPEAIGLGIGRGALAIGNFIKEKMYIWMQSELAEDKKKKKPKKKPKPKPKPPGGGGSGPGPSGP